MKSQKHFRLFTLGRLALVSVSGDAETPTQVRARHLAVLAVLALSRRAVRREWLVELFWGGQTETKARHSLSNALSALRGVLGASALNARRAEISLGPEARLAVDALEFTAAVETRDGARAAMLYRGPLLDGVFVEDAPEFDAWLARERANLARAFLTVCEQQAPAFLRAGTWAAAAAVAEQWLRASPRSAAAFTTLLRARAGPDTAAALQAGLDEYARQSAWLLDEAGVRPDPLVAAVAAELSERLSTVDSLHAARVVVDTQRPTPPSAAAPDRAGPPEPSSALDRLEHAPVVQKRRWPRALLAAAAVVVVGVAVVVQRRMAQALAAPSARPVIVVATIDNVGGDTALVWLKSALPQMIAADLSGTSGLEVVAPSRVRDAIARAAGRNDARLSDDQAADLARRLGATLVVTGGLTAGSGLYMLDVTISDVATHTQLETYHLIATNPIELGRLSAVRLVDAASARASSGAPRFADIETTSPEAYKHFVRGLQASEQGRYPEDAREFDQAIALDSGFVSALRSRLAFARDRGDVAMVARLNAVIAKHPDRVSDYDRLDDEITAADTAGGLTRSEALAAELVRRYPHDPRSYGRRAELLLAHGRWRGADTVLQSELALDSLAMSAGDGPCAPCEVYYLLAFVRLNAGDLKGAEQAARRWASLQGGLPAAWASLLATLARAGQFDEAIAAGRHLSAMSDDPRYQVEVARALLMSRQFGAVDSLLAVWRTRRDPVRASAALDIAAMLERERGQFAASVRTLEAIDRRDGLQFVRADGLARMGRLAEARRIFELLGHDPGFGSLDRLLPPQARGFAWAHALEADALLRAGDTVSAMPLIDSVARIGAVSYYGRDWLLPHHLMGMLAALRGDYPTAERELRSARWGVGGWTRTDLELARVLLAEHRPQDAVAALRDAYVAPLDAMGRYVPRSELDSWMARAFTEAGQADSAARYGAFARAALVNADRGVKPER
jgi:DNA-binding SARP family transcriptional activator